MKEIKLEDVTQKIVICNEFKIVYYEKDDNIYREFS